MTRARYPRAYVAVVLALGAVALVAVYLTPWDALVALLPAAARGRVIDAPLTPALMLTAVAAGLFLCGLMSIGRALDRRAASRPRRDTPPRHARTVVALEGVALGMIVALIVDVAPIIGAHIP